MRLLSRDISRSARSIIPSVSRPIFESYNMSATIAKPQTGIFSNPADLFLVIIVDCATEPFWSSNHTRVL